MINKIDSIQRTEDKGKMSLRKIAFYLLCAGCFLLVTAGCVRRSLTIRTEPGGAKVYVNDELKGESPITYDFMWYGNYRVTIRKDGFERLDDKKLLRAPIRLWMPFDLVMELLPFQVSDERVWSYNLKPSVQLPTPIPPELLGLETRVKQPEPSEIPDVQEESKP